VPEAPLENNSPESPPSPSQTGQPPVPPPTTQSGGGVPANLDALRFRDSNRRFLQAKGESSTFEVVLLDRAGQEIQASVPLNWQSSRPEDFSVNAQGLITALVDTGYSEITVRIPGTAFEARSVINVNSPGSGTGGGGGSGGGSAPVPVQPLRITQLEASSQTLIGTGSLLRLQASAVLGANLLAPEQYSWRCLQSACNTFTPATGAVVFWQAPATGGTYTLELTVQAEGRSTSQQVSIEVLTGVGEVQVN
jgi:hypothetical protein